jgi:dipeptidyl aminopeptidase/acylaminoacyl peptidase
MPRFVTLIALAAATALPLGAQNNTAQGSWDPQQILRAETFVKPPANVERMIMAPRVDISFTTPSPDRRWFLKVTGPDRGDIEAYGKAHLNLGGLQIDHKANRARSVTTSTRAGLILVDPRTPATKTIETPKGATLWSQTWSPNGSQIAYIANFDDASYVYVADVATGKSTQLSKAPLNATFVTNIDWTADGKSIVAVLVPDGRGAPPAHPVADGPEVRLTEGVAKPQVMHFDLLSDPHEKAMLTHYTTGQLALIDVKAKTVKKIGAPATIRAVDASPDGQYFRVTRLVEPYSYVVPVNSFGTVQELWDATGKVVATLTRTPLRESGRGGGGGDPDNPGAGGQQAAPDTGKRNLQWNPVGPGMVYIQSMFTSGSNNNQGAAPAGRGAGRGGRGGQGAQQGQAQASSVRYMNWLPPYGPSDTKVIYEGSGRLTNVAYSADAKTMFIADSGTVAAIRTADPSKKYSLGAGVTLPGAGGGGFGGGGRGGRGGGAGGGNTDSVSGGALALKRGPNGEPVVVVGSDNKTVFVSGTRAPGARWNTLAPRPWVEKIDFETGQRTRVFDSPTDAYEEFVAALDDDYTQYIYTRESPTIIVDAYLRDTRAGTSKKITDNKDIGPEVTGAQVKRFQVTRPRDGIKFWVDVTLPRDWRTGTKLPGIIWFYPREYTSQANYDQSKYGVNINRFPAVPSARPASATKIWVSQGYALIEPDLPIMGDSGRMNDNYTRDLRENLDLIVDAVVDAGYVDRNKMGIGGHSYGAFSTVNAMTLVPYFKAGIAGDGMYNRSLTPFGFQSERRDFFNAMDTYLDMSPFFRADKISGALLMYHADEDQNVGTAPISSIRMFHALQGLGKPAAMYMYHYEDHSVATYASDLDLWARWLAWFDVYVKNPKAPVTP